MVAVIVPDWLWANEDTDNTAIVTTTANAILDFIVLSSGPIARDSLNMRATAPTLNAREMKCRGREVKSR